MKMLHKKMIKLTGKKIIMKTKHPNIMLSLINNFLKYIIYSSSNCLVTYQGIGSICEFSSRCEFPLLKNRNKMFVSLQHKTNSIFILELTITELVYADHTILPLEFYCSPITQPCQTPRNSFPGITK